MHKYLYIIGPPRRKNKKYSVYKWNEEEQRHNYLLSFGDIRYQHYKDNTPLNLYENLNHLDEKRKDNYYKRHGTTNNKDLAKWWSNNYLWK